jgi:hypothetical protein
MSLKAFFQSCGMLLCLACVGNASAGGWVRQHVDTKATLLAAAEPSASSSTASDAFTPGWIRHSKLAQSTRLRHHALRLDPHHGKPVYLCRVPVGRGMYPGITHGKRSACHYLYNPCVVGCERTGQNTTAALHRCIHACRDRMDVGQSNHYDVYKVANNEKPVKWAEATFGNVPKRAWKVGWGAHKRSRYVCRVRYNDRIYFGMVRSIDNRGHRYHRGYCDTFDPIRGKDTRDFYHYKVLVMGADRYAHIWF